MSWFSAKPPANRPKRGKATKATNKQAIEGIHKHSKIPGMNMKVRPGKTADRMKDIFFPSTMDARRKDWAKRGTAPKLPPIGGGKGKKK